jgi:hypothetical protein
MAGEGAGAIGRIPFTAYDVFASLAPGFVVILAVDRSFHRGWILRNDLPWTYALYWLGGAYILGQLIANLSGWLIERQLTQRCLGCSEAILLGGRTSRLSRVFPGYFSPLPAHIQSTVKDKFLAGAQLMDYRAVFLTAQPKVRRDDAARGKLEVFLVQYGFARNMSVACAAAFIILIGQAVHEGSSGLAGWAAVSLGTAIGLYYRYLKFYRQYTFEVLINYAISEDAGDTSEH